MASTAIRIAAISAFCPFWLIFVLSHGYHAATVSGTIDTIPETPGLAVWHEGHIGVYIGNGEVVEAMGTRYGVVKTKLEGARWTHWLKIPYISYD